MHIASIKILITIIFILYNYLRNDTHYFVVTYKGKESEKLYTYICVWITQSLRYMPETDTAL